MDVALILDLSGSIEVAYDIVTRLAEEIIYLLPLEDDTARLGMISYQDKATLNLDLDALSDKKSLLNAIAFPSFGGKTNTQEALKMSYRELFSTRANRRNAADKVILVTDGRSNISPGNTVKEASRMKDDEDIEIFVVAVGSSPDMREVDSIASDPKDYHVTTVRSPQDVEDAALDLLSGLCSQKGQGRDD